MGNAGVTGGDTLCPATCKKGQKYSLHKFREGRNQCILNYKIIYAQAFDF